MSHTTPSETAAEFTTTVTVEMLRAAQPVLLQALIAQNRALETWLEQVSRIKRKHAFVVVEVLLIVIAGLAFWIELLRRSGWYEPLSLVKDGFWLVVGGCSLLLFLFCVLLGHHRLDGWLHRFVDRMLGRRVERVIARTARQAPFDVTYLVAGQSYRATIEKIALNKTVDIPKGATLYRGPGLYCLFKKRRAQKWAGIVYVGSNEHQQAFDQLFARCNVEVCNVTPASV